MSLGHSAFANQIHVERIEKALINLFCSGHGKVRVPRVFEDMAQENANLGPSSLKHLEIDAIAFDQHPGDTQLRILFLKRIVILCRQTLML